MSELYGEIRRLDPVAGHARWRAVRDDLFGTHPSSALDAEQRKSFHGLRYWPYDPRFRYTAAVRPLSEHRDEVQTSTAEKMVLRRFGRVELPVGALDVFWIEVYGGGVFIPFRDGTSGKETYGGGRYLLDTAKSADLGSTDAGELVLDFNFAYHPSCQFNDRWSCPLAPRENWLVARIEAGERSYSGAAGDGGGGYEPGAHA